MLTKKRVGKSKKFKRLNLPSFGGMFCVFFKYILIYFYSLGGMVLMGASTTDCAHRGLVVNAPDWGLARRFLVGTAVQGNEIFQVQFDVASSTATCYYGL